MSALTFAVSLPWLRGLFGFVPLGWPRLAEAAAAALGCIVVNDVIGVVWRWIAIRFVSRHPTMAAHATERAG
jgi:hypothetical protein